MSRRESNFMLTRVPSEQPNCAACRDVNDTGRLRPTPPRFDDAAMDLARRGADAHEIAHVMLTWASEAAERAIEWAAREDARYSIESREAKWDTDHGTEYEDPES